MLVRSGADLPWMAGRSAQARTAAKYPAAIRRDHLLPAPWTVAVPQRTPADVPWVPTALTDAERNVPWGEYRTRPAAAIDTPHPPGIVADADRDLPWGKYLGRPSRPIINPHPAATVADRSADVPWGMYRARLHSGWLVRIIGTVSLNPWWVIPWGPYGQRLNPGWGVPSPDGRPPTDDRGTILIPDLEVYVVINEITMVLAETGEPIPLLRFDAALDAQSWGWSCNASVPESARPLLMRDEDGTPVEVIASVNGEPIRWVVETLRRERKFGTATLSISGRSRAAELAEPASPIITRSNSETRTAQQLLADALTINGASLGWDLDWQITDWIVPEGVWSYSGTYLGAATRIAEAGGGYVQAHDTDRILQILPWYPAAPWEWPDLIPDFDLPEGPVTVEGVEWIERPRYNAVWVSGQAGGRQDRILRAGTTGDRTGPTIVDPLATDPLMTRQRGLRMLSDTGRQARISLRMPILDESGILRPGMILDYTAQGQTQRGIVRGVRISTDRPAAWQSLELEVHP